MSAKKEGQKTNREKAFRRLENMHHHKTFLFFAIIGSTLAFLSLVFLYAIRISDLKVLDGFTLPKIFSVSTIVFLISSYTISRCASAFKADNMNDLRISLFLTLILGMVFCATQVLGFRELYKAGFYINEHPGVAFLYLITGFHLMHVLLGFVAVSYLNFNANIVSNDMVKQLLFFSSKREKNKLEIVTFYWHFVDVIWLVVYFVFLFSL